jgi:DNA modification methylase
MKIVYESDSVKLYEGVAENLDLIKKDSVNLVVTSAPYNIKTGSGGAWKVDDWYEDDIPEEQYQEWQISVLKEIERVLVKNGSLFYVHKNRMRDGQTISPLGWILKSGLVLHQEIVWWRGSTHNKNRAYFWDDTERIYWLSKTNKPYYNGDCGGQGTVWKIPFGVNTWHPAPFPIQLPERCILACSKPGDTVLDPFSGSGTTVRAAQDLGRMGIGVDKSLEYLEKSKLRLAQEGM